MIAHDADRWITPERGAALALGALLLYAAAGYRLNRPLPVADLLIEARADLTGGPFRAPGPVAPPPESSAEGRDPFVSVALQEKKKTPIPAKPPPTPEKPPESKQPPKPENEVALPPRPKEAPPPPKQGNAPPPETPPPVALKGIVRLEAEGGALRAFVAPLTGGAYAVLGEGDEFVAGERIKVMKIEADGVTFRRENGKVFRLPLQPDAKAVK